MTLTAGESLTRLLSIVPWVASRDGVAIDEICARFDLNREQLLEDLETVFLVGVHPFTPDELIEVRIDDDKVWIKYADYFARPLRLTSEQALAVITAGSSMLRVPGADDRGPLARGLAKLATVVGVDLEQTLDVQLGDAPDDTLVQLRDAVTDGRRVEITYYAYGRDAETTRVVDPYAVYANGGQWYLTGWCHRAEGERVFRVDRILGLTVLDDAFDPPARFDRDTPMPRDPGLPRVELELDDTAGWVAEQYPVDQVSDASDGRVRVTLAVTEPAWLERLLVRLGPHAVLRSADPPLQPDQGAVAAARILTRYRAD